MSLLFNKEPPVFDKNGVDDDGWTRQDHANLAKYGTKSPSKELVERVERERKLQASTGRWF